MKKRLLLIVIGFTLSLVIANIPFVMDNNAEFPVESVSNKSNSLESQVVVAATAPVEYSNPDGEQIGSEFHEIEEPSFSTATDMNSMLTTYYEWLCPSGGEYFPDTSYARITKHVWLDNPYDSTTYVIITFGAYNPDDTILRYFRIFVDGVKYETTGSGPTISWSKALYLSDGNHEITYEINYGAYGDGWALTDARIVNVQHSKVYASGDLASGEALPRTTYARSTKYFYASDYYSTVTEYLHVKVSSTDTGFRRLRIYIDSVQIYSSYFSGGSKEATINIGSRITGQDFHYVMVEVYNGGYATWNIDYLAIERADVAKYVPKTFSLTVSFNWDPSTSYLDDFKAGLREFCDHLWDAYEEQVIVTTINIYTNSVNWNSANIRCYNDFFNPYANVYAPRDSNGNPIEGSFRGAEVLNLPKYWPSYLTTWVDYRAYVAITHEFSHAFFDLADEYIGDNPSDPAHPPAAECRPYIWESTSIMDGQVPPWPKTEFCVRINHDPDHDTAQSAWWWDWSCWRTIKYMNPEMYEPYTITDTLVDNVAANYVNIYVH